MIPHLISYKDIDGNPAEVTYHFNLNISELAEMKEFYKEDVAAYFQKLLKTTNTPDLILLWKDMLMRAVCVRDGMKLVKTPELRAEFEQTKAYDALFMEVIQSDNAGADLFKGMLPKELQNQVDAAENETFTDKQKLAMSDEEFAEACGTSIMDMSKHDMALAMMRKETARAAVPIKRKKTTKAKKPVEA